MRRVFQFILAVMVVFSMSACIEEQQEIGREVIPPEQTAATASVGVAIPDIRANQEKYQGKIILVSGKVMPGLAFEFVSEQPYQIIQGESLLWVITAGVAPREGAFVTIKGKVAAPYQIKGRSYDLVLLEEERR